MPVRISHRPAARRPLAALAAALAAAPALAAPSRIPPAGQTVAILGDVGTGGSVDPIRDRLDAVCRPREDAETRLDAIEVATDVDLGPAEDRFAPIDALVRLARDRGLGLYLRVKPAVGTRYAKASVRNTKGTADDIKPSGAISFLDPAYRAAIRRYFQLVAARYAGEPVVLGIGIGLCPSGEPQYNIEDGGYFGDFSETALADYRAWMARVHQAEVAGWPALPPSAAPDTRIAREPVYYHWAQWRAVRLAEVLRECAAEVRAAAPRLSVYAFSYIDLAPPAGYAPGYLEESPDFDAYLGCISMDHAFFARRGTDRSRAVAMGAGGARKRVAAELDLVSAYTDPVHMEAYARYLLLMNGQPRPFLPTWWAPGKSGGWAESFWSPYSDDLAREMIRVVNRNRGLAGGESVADVAVIHPDLSGMGAMAGWGPWVSEEFKACHTDVVRHLAAIGSNFDILTEDTLTAAKLQRYRLVVATMPALYAHVRKALAECKADLLVLGWSGLVTVPGPEDRLPGSESWTGAAPAWWATGGVAARRAARFRFAESPRLGSLAGQVRDGGAGIGPVTYVRGLRGTALATDDEGQAVAAVAEWGNGRHVTHLGLPIEAGRDRRRILSDADVREILTNVLRASGCTAYGDLGPLRLYETSRHLLVECPDGTKGTVAKPEGDYEGTLPVRTKRRPAPEHLAPSGELRLKIRAGKSVVIPLR